MAIGLSWMFNIRLPFNFNSPYKATNISDFWRRWHISLSTFLRDYLYVPLGGNRKGAVRRYVNLGITMVLGGLWHGASWSFVLWGTLHGAYLCVNHAFRAAVVRLGWGDALDGSRTWRVLAWTLTFLAVVAAWVFFRAETLPGALRLLAAMAGIGLGSTDPGLLLWNAGLSMRVGFGWCALLALIALTMPNSNAIGERMLAWFARSEPARFRLGPAAATLAAMLVVVNTLRDSVSAFIYFNF
jgi:alginate O-acetyltransferase complex protein AlgI